MTAPFVSRPPGINTQLNNGQPSRQFDCGVMGTRRSIQFASFNQVNVPVATLRRLMGKPGLVATDPRDWKRAIEHPEVAAMFQAAGLQAPRARMLYAVDDVIAEADLNKGKLVTAAVWYGTINQLKPGKSCSRTFNDNHCVSFLGKLTVGPKPVTTEYDSLADGREYRRAGETVNYPKGPQTFPWNVATQAFANVRLRTRGPKGEILDERRLGNGKIWCITVARAKPIAVTPPDPQPPQPPETPQQTIDRLTRELAIATTVGDAARRMLATAEVELAAALSGLVSARNAALSHGETADDEVADLNAAITAAGGTP